MGLHTSSLQVLHVAANSRRLWILAVLFIAELNCLFGGVTTEWGLQKPCVGVASGNRGEAAAENLVAGPQPQMLTGHRERVLSTLMLGVLLWFSISSGPPTGSLSVP